MKRALFFSMAGAIAFFGLLLAGSVYAGNDEISGPRRARIFRAYNFPSGDPCNRGVKAKELDIPHTKKYSEKWRAGMQQGGWKFKSTAGNKWFPAHRFIDKDKVHPYWGWDYKWVDDVDVAGIFGHGGADESNNWF